MPPLKMWPSMKGFPRQHQSLSRQAPWQATLLLCRYLLDMGAWRMGGVLAMVPLLKLMGIGDGSTPPDSNHLVIALAGCLAGRPCGAGRPGAGRCLNCGTSAPDPIAARAAPPSSTASSSQQNERLRPPRHGLPTSSPSSPIIPPQSSTNSRPGIGDRETARHPPPEAGRHVNPAALSGRLLCSRQKAAKAAMLSALLSKR